MGPRCSSAETQVCHRSYIIAASLRCAGLCFFRGGIPLANLSPSFEGCLDLAFVSSVDLILRYKTQSSAKSLTVDPVEMTSGKSLMKSRNSGPSTLPWGTPDWTGTEVDVAPSNLLLSVFEKVPNPAIHVASYTVIFHFG